MEKLKSLSARPQNYRHNYFLVLITGLLGCKWHRYKQSKEANGKAQLKVCEHFLKSIMKLDEWNLLGSGFALASSLYTCFIFYVWMALHNDYYTIATTHTLEWDVSFYLLGLILICFLFSYHAIVFILCLLHIHHGFQLYIHPLHLLVSFISTLGCTTVVILLCTFHPQWWSLFTLSLKVSGPFLDIGILITVTLVCFILIRQWLLTSWRLGKWLGLGSVAVILSCLWFAPLAMDSPLVADSTPPIPRVIALGGSANEAPINSQVAFKKSISERVAGICVTVQFSSDGVPFIFDESSLDPWTDAGSRLSEEDKVKGLNPMDYTMAQLKNLTHGHWYIHHDPFRNADELTKEELVSIQTAPILTLAEFLLLLGLSPRPPSTLFASEKPLPKSHALSIQDKYAIVNNTLKNSAWNGTTIYWKSSGDQYFRQISDASFTNTQSAVYLEYDEADKDTIRYYQAVNVTVVVGGVNTDWMMSYFHFLRVDFVATYQVSQMMDYRDPVWTLSNGQFKALWVSMDLLSLISLAVVYVFLRIRLFGARFTPESISLNAGRTVVGRQSRSRNMKEKLLREGAGMDTLEDTEMQTGGSRCGDDDGLENNPMETSAAAATSASAATYAIASCSGSVLGGHNVEGAMISPSSANVNVTGGGRLQHSSGGGYNSSSNNNNSNNNNSNNAGAGIMAIGVVNT